MGARLCALVREDGALELVGAVDDARSASIGRRAVPGADDSPIVQIADDIGVLADVVIDFSTAGAVSGAVACARRAEAALLVGTTGLSGATMDALHDESTRRAVLVAPNTALGVSATVRIASEAAKLLGEGFGCTIVEAHHAGKRDAPSGTAKRLVEALRGAGCDIGDERVLSIRGGDTIGEHVIRFDGPGETIEITHRAVSRDLFVRGAILAATWLCAQSPGWWTMDDVLGFGAD